MIQENVDGRIRILNERDSEEIRRFTKDLCESGYIQYLLEYHRKHPERTIPFVFEGKSQIKAICFFHYSNDRDGWLMGMRVKKEYQRGGIIAVQFTDKMATYAREKGLEWIGLNTSFRNKSVQKICKRLQFVRNGAYHIFEFNIIILKLLKQTNTFNLCEVTEKNKIENYFKKRRIGRYLFVIDPAFIWIRLTDSILKKTIEKRSFYFYRNRIIAIQKWGRNIVFNSFGKWSFIEYVDFLAQLYKELPEGAKGRIIFCVRKGDSNGINQLYNKLASPVTLEKGDVERSLWYLYGKYL